MRRRRRGLAPSFNNEYYLELDGNGDYAYAGSGALAVGSDDFSISFWHRKKTAGDKYSAYKGDSGDYFYIMIEDDDLRCILYVDSTTEAYIRVMDETACATLNDTNWHHIVFAFDRSDTSNCKMYIDDDEVSGYTWRSVNTNNANFGGNFEIGRYVYNPCYDIEIDEFAVIGKNIDADDVTTLYGDGTPQTCGNAEDIDDLINYWRMEDNGDDSAGDNDLTTVGDADYVGY